jgi:signal transduction histidine kinase
MSLDAATLNQVRTAPIFASLQDSQLGCITPGEIVVLPSGIVIASPGDTAQDFIVVLEGEIRITKVYDRQEILMAMIKAGMYTGDVPLLLGTPWLVTVRTIKPTRLFRLSEDNFWHMLSTCREVAREIIRAASNKMRSLEGFSQRREKLVSLGTMAAGLAHELNNPAAAASRAAAHLQQTTDNVQAFQCELAGILEGEHWQHLLNASEDATSRLAHAPTLTHLDRSDRADALGTWLQNHGIASAWDLAPSFVEAGLDLAWLEEVTAKLPTASHADALGWLEARLSLKILLRQVEQSTGRIAELVKAVKSYSRMDEAPMQELDIHDGIESTLTMMGHKLKNITVNRAFDRSVPRLMAYGSELNQVWTNLVDNAIDAVNGNGKICVGTCLEDNQLVVEIVDNGPGIPPDVQARMFEPFFTTKGVGSGTGLGLIISNRIVADRHGGEIEFESQPGETRFKVRLPLNRPPSPAPAEIVQAAQS